MFGSFDQTDALCDKVSANWCVSGTAAVVRRALSRRVTPSFVAAHATNFALRLAPEPPLGALVWSDTYN